MVWIATANCPCRFRSGVGQVASLCSTIAARERMFASSRRTWRRKGEGEETPPESVHTISRSCAVALHSRRPYTGRGAQSSRHARSVLIFASHGDTHRKRRGKFAFESVQPIVKLIPDRSWRVRARCGLRAVRVGEATHPGPPGDEPINDVVEALELDLGGVQPICTQVDTSCDSNRFFCLTDDCGQADADAEATLSDTESCEVPQRRRRRLRLRWNPEASIRDRDVWAAEHLFRQLAKRIGAVQCGDPVPRALHQQRWSPLNVPLM